MHIDTCGVVQVPDRHSASPSHSKNASAQLCPTALRGSQRLDVSLQ
jgi:hypothetical protein